MIKEQKKAELRNSKKAQGLSLNMIVVGAIALIVLVVIVVIVLVYFNHWHPTPAVTQASCGNLPKVNKANAQCKWKDSACPTGYPFDYTSFATDKDDNSKQYCCCDKKLK